MAGKKHDDHKSSDHPPKLEPWQKPWEKPGSPHGEVGIFQVGQGEKPETKKPEE